MSDPRPEVLGYVIGDIETTAHLITFQQDQGTSEITRQKVVLPVRLELGMLRSWGRRYLPTNPDEAVTEVKIRLQGVDRDSFDAVVYDALSLQKKTASDFYKNKIGSMLSDLYYSSIIFYITRCYFDKRSRSPRSLPLFGIYFDKLFSRRVRVTLIDLRRENREMGHLGRVDASELLPTGEDSEQLWREYDKLFESISRVFGQFNLRKK